MQSIKVLENFIRGEYEQILCPKCEATFLTNVYEFDEGHVLLEKRSYGLEYYCGAIKTMLLEKVPEIQRIGIIDEDDNPAVPPADEIVYSGHETDLRFIYIMEKLEHLNEADIVFFDNYIKDLDWKDDANRKKVLEKVSQKYNPQLAEDIDNLYAYYKQHKNVLAWDLHGDNLMKRAGTEEILILDPYTRSV